MGKLPTSEKPVKNRVKQILRDFGVHWFMPVQTGYGSPHLDFICCLYGKFFAIETKAPGKKMSPRQEATSRTVLKAGGDVLMIDGTNYDVLIKYCESVVKATGSGQYGTPQISNTVLQ